MHHPDCWIAVPNKSNRSHILFMLRAVPIFLLAIIFLASGCTTETGKVVEQTKMTIYNPQNSADGSAGEAAAREDFENFQSSNTSGQITEPEQAAVPETSEAEIPQEQEQIQQEPPPEQSTEQTPTCPASCDDSDACTKDFCSKQTDYICVHNPILPCCGNSLCDIGENWSTCQQECDCNIQCAQCQTLEESTCVCKENPCTDSDSCCPSGCTYTSDSDCPKPDMCSLDLDCDDSDSCTTDSCTGQPKDCSHSPVTECSSGDSCCPESCDFISDSDCPKPTMVFSEVYYNAPGADTGHEWVEVYNNGTEAVDLTKWRFEQGASHKINMINESIVLPGSYAVLADNSTQFLLDYPGYPGLLFDSTFSLNNVGETLVLRTGPDGEIIDMLAYNSTWGGDGDGFSLEKIDLNSPNTAENWKPSSIEKGTPGQTNSVLA
jgi:hypothetical protein